MSAPAGDYGIIGVPRDADAAAIQTALRSSRKRRGGSSPDRRIVSARTSRRRGWPSWKRLS